MLLEEAERLEESNEEDLAEEDLILTYNKRYFDDKSASFLTRLPGFHLYPLLMSKL